MKRLMAVLAMVFLIASCSAGMYRDRTILLTSRTNLKTPAEVDTDQKSCLPQSGEQAVGAALAVSSIFIFTIPLLAIMSGWGAKQDIEYGSCMEAKGYSFGDRLTPPTEKRFRNR